MANDLAMVRALTVLDWYSDDHTIRFVIDHGDGTASWGYAAAAWGIDLYRWVRLGEPCISIPFLPSMPNPEDLP